MAYETELFEYLTPRQAWDELVRYRMAYYRKYAAPYSGERLELNATGEKGTFWSRPGKVKIHVPIAADIASTSADILFSEEPRFMCFDEDTEDNESAQQKRLDELVDANNMHGKLNEAAESCAALGDIFLKLNWRQEELDHPIITVTQPDSAWPEYVLGVLKCIHFFSIFRADSEKNQVWRIYERYERGKISMAVFKGSKDELGNEVGEEILTSLGYASEIIPPVDDMLAVHIPNIRPNRSDRGNVHGRCDYDGLRGLMDALDECYSSWMRDIRLAKARLIVPAEYLRRKPADMFNDNTFKYEFDEDVETLVALDINTEAAGAAGITSSQFQIRAEEHAATCTDIIRQIVTISGYSPQSFGLDIDGNAQSGTALHIREKKSFNTRGKKQTYWKAPLEQIMTAMVHLDAAIYPKAGSDTDDAVKVHFADSMANDISTMATSIELLNRAMAISTEMKVQMMHPDWTKKQVNEEIDRIKEENGMNMDSPLAAIGDYEDQTPTEPGNGGGRNE